MQKRNLVLPDSKGNLKREIHFEDIEQGDVVEFYDNGFRFAVVIKTKKTKKNSVVYTDFYGKVPLEKISEVYVYDENKKTVRKPLTTDLFE